MGKNLIDAVTVRIAQKDAARLMPDFAEPLAPLTYRGRVDDRQRLADIVNDE